MQVPRSQISLSSVAGTRLRHESEPKLANCLNPKSSEERVVYKRLNSTER